MRQLQLFSSTELAGMRDRTAARNYSPEREEFRREHARHRAWGLIQRHNTRLRRLHGSSSASPAADAHDNRRQETAYGGGYIPVSPIDHSASPSAPVPGPARTSAPAPASAPASAPAAASGSAPALASGSGAAVGLAPDALAEPAALKQREPPVLSRNTPTNPQQFHCRRPRSGRPQPAGKGRSMAQHNGAGPHPSTQDAHSGPRFKSPASPRPSCGGRASRPRSYSTPESVADCGRGPP
jgi:hypothetical protein